MYRAFSSVVEASEKDKWSPNVATIRVTRPTAPRLLQESDPTETQQRLLSRDAAPGLPAESVGAGRTS